ncbi:ABC transporter substrate-binding protein [Cohnella kolymensis]|uniref:ABC transporter substrate-binding protein n=2 Tax=Cohnella kolymensis TaxID=1590652 RepID=A0ABR5A9I1_9BACL|nr:ABC transporter substrate-binding protein [Cohnella kolymensis]
MAASLMLWGCSSQGTSTSAAEPSQGATTIAELAANEGKDRLQILTDGAQKEKTLIVYTSRTNEDIERIKAGFEKKYGITVTVWRAGSDVVLQKVITEAKAGRNEFDMVDISGTELEALHQEGLLQAVKSPYHADLIPQALPEHREWVTTSLNLFVQTYNTNLVKKEDLPKKYEDLLDPKWKGRLGIELEDSDYFSIIVKKMGEEKGLKFWRDLVAANGLDVRKGHTLITNLVRSGEIPLGLTVYNFTAEQYKKEGSPLDWFVIDPAVARPNGIGVSKKAPHPYASLLFYDYMLNEGQQEMANLSFIPSSTKVESPYSKIKIEVIDPAVLLKERNKWADLYDEIIIKREK